MRLRLAVCDSLAQEPFGPTSTKFSHARIAKPTNSIAIAIPAGPKRGRSNGPAPGVRRYAVVASSSTITMCATGCMAIRRSPTASPSGSTGRNSGWTHLLQRRRHFDARQVGVSLVRGLGSGVSLHPAWRWSIRTSPRSSSSCCCANGTCIPTDRFPPMNGRLAMSIRRFMPGRRGASTRSNRSASGAGRSQFPGTRLSQTAAELHLVGEPQGRRREQHLSRRLPGSRQHRRIRPKRAAADRRRHRAIRRHQLDGACTA